MKLNISKMLIRKNIFLIVLCCIYLIYLISFINQGFNATDEGWLIQLGDRIAQGQIPYKDFHYNRPPLSIYMQAFYIDLIKNYSIIFSRLILGIEVFLCILLTFFLVKKNVNLEKENYLYFVSLIFFSTCLFFFPWYNYDAIFFALIAIFFLFTGNFEKRGYIIVSGFFSFLSFMTKQNFIIFPISVIFLSLVNQTLNKYYSTKFKPNLHIVPSYILGFLFGLMPYSLYLIYTNTLGQFFYHVFILPEECFNINTNFFLFNNSLSILYIPLMTILLMFLVVDFKNKSINIIRYFIVTLLLPVIYFVTNKITFFIISILIFNFLVLITQLSIAYYYKMKNRKILLSSYLLSLIFFALILQYIASLSYSGIIHGYMGSFLSFILALIILYNNFFIYPKKSFKFFRIHISKKLITLFAISFLFLNIFVNYNFVYRDYPRSQLKYQFSNEKMKGIFSNENNVKRIDELVGYIEGNTNKDDYIFIFPDFSVIYYLTERKNPTKIDWYVEEEFTEKMALEAIQDLEKNKPKLIFLQSYRESDYMRIDETFDYLSNPKNKIIYEYITKNYNRIDQIYDIFVYASIN